MLMGVQIDESSRSLGKRRMLSPTCGVQRCGQMLLVCMGFQSHLYSRRSPQSQSRPGVPAEELTRRFERWQRRMQVLVAVILVCAALDGSPLSRAHRVLSQKSAF